MFLSLVAAAEDNFGKFFAEYWWLVLGGAVVLIFLLVFLVICLSFLRLWIQAWLASAKIGFVDMIRMKLLNVDYAMIVRQKIALVQAGVKISTQEMEAHALAKGNQYVPNVARAVITAHKAGIDMPWRTAAAIDLAGRDVIDAVRVSVNPKVIDCPDPSKGRPTLDGVCKNGIQLKARARVTVRTKLDRLVGGAPPEKIIPPVGGGNVKAIGPPAPHTGVALTPNPNMPQGAKNPPSSTP